MQHVLPSLVVWLAGAMFLGVVTARADRGERRLAVVGYAAEMASTFALLVLTLHVYRAGDLFGYLRSSAELADLLASDPGRTLPGLLRLVFQLPSHLSDQVFSPGRSTGTLTAIVTLMRPLLGGSEYAISAALALFSFFGRYAMFRAMRRSLPGVERYWVFAACMLVPSTVLWSAGIVKESLAVGGLGILTWGVARGIEGRVTPRVVLAVGFGGLVVGLMKAYFLVPFAAAAAAWWVMRRGVVRRGRVVSIRPARVAAAAVLTIGVVTVLGTLFPSYAITNLAEESAVRQERGLRNAGGSTYVLVDQTQTTPTGRLAVAAPLALATALGRPLVTEARNPVLLVSALEMLAFVVLALRMAVRWPVPVVVRTLMSNPPLLFCAIMTVGAALGVGLATTNLGTLARYRSPMLPFYLLGLAGLDAALRATAADARRRARSRRAMATVTDGLDPVSAEVQAHASPASAT